MAIGKKCLRCLGCMQYQQIDKKLFLYCDFCKQYYHRLPGGVLERVDNLEEYVKKLENLNWFNKKE